MKLVNIKNILIAFLLIVSFASVATAGDAKVEVDLEQKIDMSFLDVVSNDGEAEVNIGSIIAHGNSNIKANVKSEIRITSMRVSTNDGRAIASIGAIIAGR